MTLLVQARRPPPHGIVRFSFNSKHQSLSKNDTTQATEAMTISEARPILLQENEEGDKEKKMGKEKGKENDKENGGTKRVCASCKQARAEFRKQRRRALYLHFVKTHPSLCKGRHPGPLSEEEVKGPFCFCED